jgi:hypothetical protein
MNYDRASFSWVEYLLVVNSPHHATEEHEHYHCCYLQRCRYHPVEQSSTTVVNSVVVWHYILSNEGGHSVADSGSEDA